ncbi:MAG: HAD-IIA family hydrolase [Anaerolineales bacterium]|nr:HAD-IIA family hydrolase [Anaerolineales bacterium]
MERRSVPHIYITNNSTMTPQDLSRRLEKIGLITNSAQILTSVTATMAYMSHKFPPGTKVYPVGESGLQTALEKAGFVLSDDNVDAVVVGLDREINYEKIQRASSLILSGATFVACNADSGAPTPDGIAPGAGAMVYAIQAVTKVEPIIIGKPQPAIFIEGMNKLGLSAEETASVGDRLDVDIQCAHQAGMMGILVLSGLTTREMLSQSTIRPNLVFDNIGDMAEKWDKVLDEGGCDGNPF